MPVIVLMGGWAAFLVAGITVGLVSWHRRARTALVEVRAEGTSGHTGSAGS